MEKNLEDLTVIKLREMARNYPEIVGVHAMKKAELIDAIRKVTERPEKEKKKTAERITKSMTDLKREIRTLKAQRQDAVENKDRKGLKSLRRRIKKLKRKTKRRANAVIGSS
ncbi:MAG: transcription termination factor Rho [Pseudomonadota bacterium]